MRVVSKRLRLESRSFRYKVAWYLSMYIKFDDEINIDPFEFQAYFPISLPPKLNWRLSYALSQLKLKRALFFLAAIRLDYNTIT